MKQVASADGGRYSDGQLVWWNVGRGGFLANADEDRSSTSTQLAANCHEDATKPASQHAPQKAYSINAAAAGSESASGLVMGRVSYLQRVAMPPTALVEVQLQDISRVDAAAEVVAEQKIDFGDRQVPIPFELKFDPAKINEQHHYSLSATIVVDGTVRFRTDTVNPVITHGHPSKADLILKQVVEAAPTQH
jgi:putative lipoprotein